MADAVKCAYRLGSIDKLADVAFLVCGLIQGAYQESEELPWPPTADDMTIKSDQLLPKELIKFLNLVMNGKPEVGDKCEKTRRLVLSISQDLCRAVETSKAYSALHHHPTHVP